LIWISRKGRDLVFVAMGTGVAACVQLCATFLNRKEDFGQLVVLYGARTPTISVIAMKRRVGKTRA